MVSTNIEKDSSDHADCWWYQFKINTNYLVSSADEWICLTHLVAILVNGLGQSTLFPCWWMDLANLPCSPVGEWTQSIYLVPLVGEWTCPIIDRLTRDWCRISQILLDNHLQLIHYNHASANDNKMELGKQHYDVTCKKVI